MFSPELELPARGRAECGRVLAIHCRITCRGPALPGRLTTAAQAGRFTGGGSLYRRRVAARKCSMDGEGFRARLSQQLSRLALNKFVTPARAPVSRRYS